MVQRFLSFLKKHWRSATFAAITGTVFTILLLVALLPRSYDLGAAAGLLPKVNPEIAAAISYNEEDRVFDYNKDAAVIPGEGITTQSANIRAKLYKDASKGISVSDPFNNIDFSLYPLSPLNEGVQDENRIIYPLRNADGASVYTVQSTGLKEDILLNSSPGDAYEVSYKLGLGDSLEARLEGDGSIGVYGNTLLSSNVTTGTEADAALLKKARDVAEKDTLLFVIPAPFIVEKDVEKSSVEAAYTIDGDTVTLTVKGLNRATYPLSIDPSIYVVTAQQFMQGNNETNINFDVANKLIQKSPTTGARFDSWVDTTTLPTAIWRGGATAVGGYIYSIGGSSFNGRIYNTQGGENLVIPAGVTSITTKVWGGGAGGGGGSNNSTGGAGGGAGYVTATIPVTPGETLTVYVGGGGTGGVRNTTGGGGGGGGFSSIYRGSTPLVIAAGGGGGGGARSTASHTGGVGGAGGGTTGVAGGASGGSGGAVNGGGAGTQTTGGAAGTGGNNVGTAGSSLSGGLGGDGRTGAGADGSGAAGGLEFGGNGGSVVSTARSGGGGGGAGYFGGGGGSGGTNNRGGSGAGGGSSFTAAGLTSVTNSAGSGVNPGNSADAARNGAGQGGAGGAINSIGTSGTGGLISVAFGSGGSITSRAVSWAKLNDTTGTVDSTNPGDGACTGWCTSTSYDLPSERSNLSVLAYNGFLYAMGGVNSGGTIQSTVYIAKIGANGEPQLWHPTDTNKANWVYWYTDTGLPSARADSSIVAYNNRIYIMGGRSTGGPVNTVHYTDINPTGTLGSWTASTNLPYNLYGHSGLVYNDRLYILGGSSTVGGAPRNDVYHIKINPDGSLNTWQQTTAIGSSGRFSNGGNFASIWGAYVYITGGCSAVNASGFCTTTATDTQVASINADGSLDAWNTVGGVSNQRSAYNMIAWNNRIYTLGGCSSQNTTTGACDAATLDTIQYGVINRDGDASTVAQSVPSGTAPCSGGAPVGCNLPGTANIGNMLSSVVITNGYLYVISGCTANVCGTLSENTAYVAISSDGEMSRPATCPNGAYQGGAWCVDNVNTITGGVAASAPVVFGGRIYLVGGLTGASNTNLLYRTTLAADGSISAWTTQAMSGGGSIGAANVSYPYAYARANPASAATNPGNLYIFGGCASTSQIGCSTYSQGVYKCNIQTSGAVAGCTTTGQLQIGTVSGGTGTGLAIMSGTVYANYIYLIGGAAPGAVDLRTVRYAKFDNNNNVVTAGVSGWTEATNQLNTGRRRSSAFGYNGYIYVVGGFDGTSGGGVLSDIEFIKVNVSDGSLGSATDGFQVSDVTINQRWGLSIAVSNSFAYVIGGCIVGDSPGGCTTRTDVVQTFQVYNNVSGAPAGFTTAANTYGTNPNRIGASTAVFNGYMYVAGGCISATDCTDAVNTVSYSQIGVDGALGTWANTTANLPADRTWGQLEAAGNSLYYIGGQSDTATDFRTEVYYGSPSSGNVTSWQTATNGLPNARSKFGATVWNNRLYVIGGQGAGTGCAGGVCNTVYVSPQLNSGGNISSAWSTSSPNFTVPRSGLTAISYANNLYLMGGYDGANYLNDSQYARIDPATGAVGTWTFSTSLPRPLSQSEGFAANGYMYLLGGRSTDTDCEPITLVAPISANTTIVSGNNPTGIGEWYTTNQRFTGNRYGAGVGYNEGKAYVLGGGCGSTLTYATPVSQQTTLLSQPQVARYSIMIDTDTDVFPSKWLLNGVDNSVGAKWQLNYRSMTNTTTVCTSPAMTTWGQNTAFGDVTLGTPGAYIPKNAAGTNTGCARFYYFNVAVDSSRAFGYPDDFTRGPTITDLTLQFAADPSKRLLHGRTFVGGLQQPLDTPF